MSEAARIIRIIDGTPRVLDDAWRVLDAGVAWDATAPAGPLLVPLARALEQPDRLHAGVGLGLWLAPEDDPARAVEFFPHVALIGVQFPKFTDGRGYSIAMLLRTRHGWRGELRALGDVLQDQLYALRRVGFDSFALRAGRDPQAALAGFAPFSSSYQGSVDEPRPHYARQGPAR